MRKEKCANGHWFDGDKFPECPHCGAQSRLKGQEDKRTIWFLTLESSGVTVQFKKDIVSVGRDISCDLIFDGDNKISRQQATFFYENERWFLQDNFSANGTWVNGVRICPGEKYLLAPNDEISFAMSEKVIFDKQKQLIHAAGAEATNAVEVLESALATFADSQRQDESALKLILLALLKAPLYFPIEIDMDAMVGNLDLEKLKAGDVWQPQRDVKVRILTCKLDNGMEVVPMFTSNVEVNKGPNASIIRYSPQDYLPMLVQMDKTVVINLFSESRFVLSKELIVDVLLPVINANGT